MTNAFDKANINWAAFDLLYLVPWLSAGKYAYAGGEIENNSATDLLTSRCNLPDDHPGVRTHDWDDSAERIKLALRAADPPQALCILEGLLEIAPEGSTSFRTKKREQDIRKMIGQIRIAAKRQEWDDLQVERSSSSNLHIVPSQDNPRAQISTSDTIAQRDLFISHASEDKVYVRELVRVLKRLDITIWFDESEILPGLSISRAIAQGLAESEYKLVVISPSFINERKKWTHKEYGGMVAAEQPGQYLIIPIWHGVTHDDVVAYDATLADLYALDTNELSIDQIAEQINRRIQTDRLIGSQ